MPFQLESGARNGLQSLAGIHDYSGQGRKVEDKTVTCQVASTRILDNNIMRNWALIVNDGANDVYLRLGETASLNSGIPLKASGGWCLINWGMPWTGLVQGIANGGTSVLCVTEVSIQVSSDEPTTAPLVGGGGSGGINPPLSFKC